VPETIDNSLPVTSKATSVLPIASPKESGIWFPDAKASGEGSTELNAKAAVRPVGEAIVKRSNVVSPKSAFN